MGNMHWHVYLYIVKVEIILYKCLFSVTSECRRHNKWVEEDSKH
jgi:hypothetical protein